MTDKLHPRERVLAAFKHEIPDRVPIDYHANPGSALRSLTCPP